MPTIKEILQELSESDQQLLNYAFEHEIAQFVRLKGDKYIGVNVDYISYLVPESKVGAWSTGVDKSAARSKDARP